MSISHGQLCYILQPVFNDCYILLISFPNIIGIKPKFLVVLASIKYCKCYNFVKY